MTDHPLALLAPAGALPIGNEWVQMTDSIDIVFPYDGTTVAGAPIAQVVHAEAALDAADAVRSEAAALTTAERKSMLNAITERVRANAERLEDLLILETGKPRVDCRTEVNRTIVSLQATAEEASHIHGETVP